MRSERLRGYRPGQARRAVLRLAFICCTTLSAQSCLQTTALEPLPAIPVVHAVLNVAFDTQVVTVSATRGNLTATNVQIAGAHDTASLVFSYLPTYNGDSVPRGFLLLPGSLPEGIRAGEEYRLLIQLSNGQQVESRTRVPLAPVAFSVDTGTYVYGDSMRIDFQALPGARKYYLTVSQWNPYFLQLTSTLFLARFIDGPVTLGRGEINVSESFGSNLSDLFVTVSAVDHHFAQYYSVRSDPVSGTNAYTQFSNAQGVFGSVVPLMRKRLKMQLPRATRR